MSHARGILTGLVVVLIAPAASASPLDLIDIGIDQAEPAPCALGIDLACFAWYDPGDEEGMGDDTYHTFQDIERIRSRVTTPLQESLDGFADLEEGTVGVPICDTYNVVDEHVDRTLPPEVTNLVDVDMDDEGIKPTYPKLNPQDGTFTPVPQVWPWDPNVATCDYVHIPYTTYPRETDYLFDSVADIFRGCWAPWLVGPTGCDAQRRINETFLGLKEILPNVSYGAEVDEIEGGTAGSAGAATAARQLGSSSGARSAESQRPSSDATGLPDAPFIWDRAASLPVLQGTSPPVEPAHERGPVLRDAAEAGRLLPERAFSPEAFVLAALPMLAWWLYHRITGQRALEHPTRRAIHRFVHDHPGCDVAMVAAAHGLSYKTALHHVEVLKRGGFVRVTREGRRFRVALPRHGEVADQTALLRHPTRARIVARVGDEPGVRQAALARELGVTRSTMYAHVAALQRAGLVRNAAGRLHAAAAVRVGSSLDASSPSDPPSAPVSP